MEATKDEFEFIKNTQPTAKYTHKTTGGDGGRADASIQVEIEDIADTVVEIESELERRSQKLRETAALYGSSADPSISMELEDIAAYFKAKKEAEQRSNTNYA